VLPGNGASIVKKHIDKAKPFWLWQWPWKFFPCAKRTWKPGENPQTFVSRIAPTQMILGARSVVVMDDVISSGETIRHLRRINEPWIPGASWKALTWVKQESATTKGFSMVFAAKTVGLKESRVPINSLSTLIECPKIAESYAQRNFGNEAKDFEKILESLR
jgi:hypoxanthine phosphoribosyltransferase